MKSTTLPLSIRQVRKPGEAQLSWGELGREVALASRRRQGRAGGRNMPALTGVQGRGLEEIWAAGGEASAGTEAPESSPQPLPSSVALGDSTKVFGPRFANRINLLELLYLSENLNPEPSML